MARMKFKNAWNYDSAARQVDTGDFDFILDQGTDVGKAFFDVIEEAISLGMVDFIETFQEENNLLTQEQADTLYELVGAVLAHVAETDPHSQYATADELATAISGIDLSAYYTKIEADALFEAIGAAAAAISAHNAAVNPHPEYLTPAEGSAAYDALGAASAAITTHEAASNPHPVYLTQTEADALYDGTGSVGSHVAASDPHTEYQKESEKAQNNGYAPLDSSGDLPLTHLPTHTHESSGEGGTITIFAGTDTVTITTASLAADAVETGTVALPEAARLKKINPDRACRVRLYVSAAHRTADASRPIGTDVDVSTDHGLLFEYVANASIDAYLSPAPDVFQGDGETAIFYSIQNKSGSTSAVAVIFDYVRTQ